MEICEGAEMVEVNGGELTDRMLIGDAGTEVGTLGADVLGEARKGRQHIPPEVMTFWQDS